MNRNELLIAMADEAENAFHNGAKPTEQMAAALRVVLAAGEQVLYCARHHSTAGPEHGKCELHALALAAGAKNPGVCELGWVTVIALGET